MWNIPTRDGMVYILEFKPHEGKTLLGLQLRLGDSSDVDRLWDQTNIKVEEKYLF